MLYIIKFKPDIDSDSINKYFHENNCTVVDQLDTLVDVFVISCEGSPPLTDLVVSVSEDPDTGIKLLSNDTFTINTEDDSDWWKLVSARSPDLEQLQIEYERKGENAIVYVVDSGIDNSHTDFHGVDVLNLFSLNGSFNDNRGHGTAIASVISGRSCGVTNAKLASVKIFDNDHPTKVSDLLSAFNAILSHYIDNQINTGIVNLSWSIEKNSIVEDSIQYLIDAGLVVVTSAGNSGVPIENVTPASMLDVFTVGSFTEDLLPADFSNYEGYHKTTANIVNYGELDGWAPGTNIKVAVTGGTFGLSNGTSLSCAIMSAAMAYNSMYMSIDDSGTVPAGLDNTSMLGYISLSKKGILTLSEVYAGSPNLIATFITDSTNDIDSSRLRPIERLKTVLKNGLPIAIPALHPDTVVSYEYDDTLMPPGINIQKGWITGVYSGPDNKIFKVPVSYTMIDGEVINTLYKFFSIPNEMAYDDPSIDEEIRIELNFFCGPTAYDCGTVGKPFTCYTCDGACGAGTGNGSACTNACATNGTKDPADLQCYCAPPFQECI